MFNSLFSSFTANSVILTVNRRLSQVVRSAYDDYQQKLGKKIWQNPQMIPLSSWLVKNWQESSYNTAIILSDDQELYLWGQIIQADQNEFPSLSIVQIAEQVKQAWRLVQDWQISFQELQKYAQNFENDLFIKWSGQFLANCQKEGWLSSACLLTKMIELIQYQPKIISSADKIYFIGFDELSPAQKLLIKQLELSTLVEVKNLTVQPGDAGRIGFSNQYNEYLAMAVWSKDIYESDPNVRIGCVVPELQQNRALLEKVFTEVFTPVNRLPGIKPVSVPFNISAGQNLQQYPIITIAIEVLQLLRGYFSVHTIGCLLQSPYLCQSEADASYGALIDYQLRSAGQLELPLDEFYTAINRCRIKNFNSTWLIRWRKFVEQIDNDSKLPSEWSQYFSSSLKCLAWPGGRLLNSLEFQLVQRWQQLLKEFAQLDLVTGVIDLEVALQQLILSCSRIVFQPQTQSHSSIQVLGLLESSAYYFDYLWVAGLHHQAWPPVAKPNPFIPYVIQNQYQLPHANAERELNYSQQITQRLIQSANKIILSYPQQAEDKQLQESFLIKHLPQVSIDQLNLNSFADFAQVIYQTRHVEQISDQIGCGLKSNEKIQGGSWILTQQANCPFQAYARIRLQAFPLPLPQLGIQAMERGILIHRALQMIWENLQDHQTLVKSSASALSQVVVSSVANALESRFNVKIRNQFPLLFAIEQQCMVNLLEEWLAFEKKRSPFRVIGCEVEQNLQLAKLSLKLQIDRIDLLNDGTTLIMDYKTGKQNQMSSWFSDRPRQPQLPLYYLSVNKDLSVSTTMLAFAQVCLGAIGFKGLTSEKTQIDLLDGSGMIKIDQFKGNDIPKKWSELFCYWRLQLEQLAENFCTGQAQVDPLDNTICQYCDLQSLCKINCQ